jgi:hypothetical protein
MTDQPIDTAPRDGSEIVGVYESGEEVSMFWSENPVCMLGSRCGSFPEGWATTGQETDRNLPIDEPMYWRNQ